MDCDRFQEALSAKLDGHLDENQTEHFETHLGECRSCRRSAREMRQMLGLLQSLPQLEPPGAIRHRAAEKLAALAQPKPISCEEALSLVSQEMDEPLAAAEGFALGRHLCDCAACRSEAEGLHATVSAVASLPQLVPPARAVALRRVETAPASVRQRRAWVATAAFAGLAAVMAIALSVQLQRPARVSAPPASQPERAAIPKPAAPAVISRTAQPIPVAERHEREIVRAAIVPHRISETTRAIGRLVSVGVASVAKKLAPRPLTETTSAPGVRESTTPSEPSPPVAVPGGAPASPSQPESPPKPPEPETAAVGEPLPGLPQSRSVESAKQILADLNRSLRARPMPNEIIKVEKNQPAFINVALFKRKVD
jgi:predicted anti-sigma-YlaC factor YlaD